MDGVARKSTLGKLFSNAMARYSAGIVCAVIAGMGLFQVLHISVFSKFGSPHVVCYLAEPRLVWLHVVSDMLIGLAYVSISCTLIYMVCKASEDIPFHWILAAFGLFIVSCGFTHFMEVIVIWQPLYWLSGYVKVVTAASSVATALVMFPLVPKVFRLIDSVKKAEARRKQVEELNQELDAFTSSVAHDLRSPLRTMAGMSYAVKEDYSSRLDETGRDYLDRINAAAQRMDRLIIDLLTYSRITNEEITTELVSLDAVVTEVRTSLLKDIQESRATVTVMSPLGSVPASRTLLSQIVVNLLGNAIKFVPPGVPPEVTISSERTGNRLRLKIADNGIGIPEEHQRRVFKMFERLNRDYPGTGIGLAIVEKAVHRLGGGLLLSSKPGAGTTFIVEFPVNA